MCTFLNGKLAAYTGDPIPEPETIMDISEPKNIPPSAHSGEREPIRFTGSSCDDKDPGHRTNGKGGWIARNRGQKPEYKDRRLRADGSGKTRANNAQA